jgi:SAM-dependent methyltransferase
VPVQTPRRSDEREVAMGLMYLDFEMVGAARRKGARFDRVLCAGRQVLVLHASELKRLRARGSVGVDPFAGYRWAAYAEPYLKAFLDAGEVLSLDRSGYEGATILHDLNLPLASDAIGRIGRFDLVIDGGTLEHVFNVPVALKTLMSLVNPGGRLLTATPANNLLGHGLYQFSPELMYRVFSAANGFEVQAMTLAEYRFPNIECEPHTRVVAVRDPADLDERVILINDRPVVIRVLARRIADVEPFGEAPQQSFYIRRWDGANPGSTIGNPVLRVLLRLYRRLPLRAQFLIRGWRDRHRAAFSNKRAFRPVGPGGAGNSR